MRQSVELMRWVQLPHTTALITLLKKHIHHLTKLLLPFTHKHTDTHTHTTCEHKDTHTQTRMCASHVTPDWTNDIQTFSCLPADGCVSSHKELSVSFSHTSSSSPSLPLFLLWSHLSLHQSRSRRCGEGRRSGEEEMRHLDVEFLTRADHYPYNHHKPAVSLSLEQQCLGSHTNTRYCTRLKPDRQGLLVHVMSWEKLNRSFIAMVIFRFQISNFTLNEFRWFRVLGWGVGLSVDGRSALHGTKQQRAHEGILQTPKKKNSLHRQMNHTWTGACLICSISLVSFGLSTRLHVLIWDAQ